MLILLKLLLNISLMVYCYIKSQEIILKFLLSYYLIVIIVYSLYFI